MIKEILSFIVCLFTPVAIVDAINDANEADELSLLKSAGFTAKEKEVFYDA